MGYKSDVRIIVTKNGYYKLKSITEKLLDGYRDRDYFGSPDIEKNVNDIVYVGWNDVKWYGLEAESIMKGLRNLKEEGYSYRYANMGEFDDDYTTKSYTGVLEENIDIPYIRLNRSFADDEIVAQIKQTIQDEREISI